MKCEQLGKYTYRWDERCFPLGSDSLALGEFCSLKSGQTVLDLGCGAGLLLLLCAERAERLTLIGVERDEHTAALAEENLRENGLDGRILNADLTKITAPPADLVLSNPPWYSAGTGAEGGAGRMGGCTPEELFRTAASALPHKGRFAVVYRAEGLTELLLAARQAGLEPKRLQFCVHCTGKAPYAVLMEAVKGGRAGLELLPQRLNG